MTLYEVHLGVSTVEVAVMVVEFVPSVGDSITLESPGGGKKLYKVLDRNFVYYQQELPGTAFISKVFVSVE